MNKKTALDWACETIRYLCEHSDGFINDKECPCLEGFYCPKDDEYYDNKSNCISNMKYCFQQQADIPDGWEVIINLLKIIRSKRLIDVRKEEEWNKGFNDCLDSIEEIITEQLEEAGIKEE